MKFDRQKFFEGYAREFGALKQFQVDGINRLLWGFETYYGWWDFLPQIANAFSQVKHETNDSFNPVVEGYYLAKNVPLDLNYFQGKYDVVRRFQRQLYYYPFFGMGDIQLTHDDNYEMLDAYLRHYFPEIIADFENRTGKEFSLAKHPEQALDGKISFCIFTVGMHKGLFRAGHSLDRHINPRVTDHHAARNIVNGDKNYKVKGTNYTVGDKIRRDAVKFENILNYARVNEFATMTDEEIEQTISASGETPTENRLIVEQETSLSVSSSKPSAEIPLASSTPEAENGSSSVQSPQIIAAAASSDGAAAAVIVPPETPSEPLGDAPNAAPKTWFNVEDWKPRIIAWLKATWTAVSGANLTQGTVNLIAAAKDSQNAWIYVGVFVAILIFTVIAGLIITAIGLLIWHFNRKEIVHYKTEQLRALIDPNAYNIGLNFERK